MIISFKSYWINNVLLLVFRICNQNEVSEISISDFLKKENFTLFDTRSYNEFEQSHISKAILIDFDTFSENPDMSFKKINIQKTDTLIFYCSVGYRSGKVAKAFIERGFENVYNLEQGIFGFVNLKYPLVNSKGNFTDSIHSYNYTWSFLLKEGKIVY